MSSEKSRYMFKNQGPELPFRFQELSEKLKRAEVGELAELIWVRAQHDDVLCKAAMVIAGIRDAKGDWGQIKKVIDFAVHFPDYVRYTESGHGQVIHVLKSALALMIWPNNYGLAIKAATYAVEKSEEVAENFEDDWEWVTSIGELKNWITSAQSQSE